MKKSWAGVLLFALLLINASAETESLDKLVNDFWAWRAKYAPFTDDDVNRIERPGGVRDWSRSSIDSQRKDLAEFETRWKKLDANSWPIPQQVDYRLIGSALARVRWELDINPRWKRDPNFYVAQTLRSDVNRIERPGGVRDWSRSSIDSQRKDLAEFETRWKKLDANSWPIPQQVDYRLIGSALARVRWELDINPRWKRDPNFYVAQTL